jgi:hypothetical protein
MLTQDHDKRNTIDGETSVAPGSDLDATQLLHKPRVGRESVVVRIGIVLATVMAAVFGWLILSLVLGAVVRTEAISSEPESVVEAAENEATEPAEADAGETTDPASSGETSDAAETAEPAEASEGATSGSDPAPVDGEGTAASPSTGAVVDTSLNGVAVPADLSEVVTVIERSIQNLEPAIGLVLVSQDFVDFLTSQQPIDPAAVQVSSCSPQYCWVWLHGDSLESRIVVARDGGGLLLMSEG